MRPLSGEPIQVSNTIYADDAQETNVTETVEELNEVLPVGGQFLDHELSCRGLGRNGDKEEHLIQLRGRGQLRRRGRHDTT